MLFFVTLYARCINIGRFVGLLLRDLKEKKKKGKEKQEERNW